jgi:hypothetical protein
MDRSGAPPSRRSVSSPGRAWRNTTQRPSVDDDAWEPDSVIDVTYTDVEEARHAAAAAAAASGPQQAAPKPAETVIARAAFRSHDAMAPPAGKPVGSADHAWAYRDVSAGPVAAHTSVDEAGPVLSKSSGFGRNGVIALAAATALGLLLVSLDIWRTRESASGNGMELATTPIATTTANLPSPAMAPAAEASVVPAAPGPLPAPSPTSMAPITIITSADAPDVKPASSSAAPEAPATDAANQVPPNDAAELDNAKPSPRANATQQAATPRSSPGKRPASAAAGGEVDQTRLKQYMEWLERRGPKP